MQITNVSSPVTSHNIHFFIFSYSRTSPRQGNLSDPLQFQSNKRNLRSLCAHDSSQTISFQNMLFVHSLTAGGSAESLSCPKLNFQCFVADKKKRCHLSDNRRMEEAEIKGFRAMLALSHIGKFTFESPQKTLRHQGCGHWTHARRSLQLFVFRSLYTVLTLEPYMELQQQLHQCHKR